MKLRNFANKFLLVTLLVIFTFSNFTVASTPSIANLAPTEVSGYANKSYYFDQYNVNKPTDESLYTALGIKVYNDYLTALSATKNLNEVVVAVVDTGIDIDHPVFTNRILTQYAMDFSKGLPTSEVNEWDKDENGHGTHVAGIIADATLPNVKILPLKIFYGTGNNTSDYSFLNAMRYLCALKSGEKISLLSNSGIESKTENIYYNQEKVKISNIVAVNLSLGSQGFNPQSSEAMSEFKREKYGYKKDGVYYTGFQNIIDNVLKNNILPIVAAGNRGSQEYNQQPYYSLPGGCDGVLEVSAYENSKESSYKLASYSYYNDNVSVAAPGSDIWSACSDDIAKHVRITDITSIKNNCTYYKHISGSNTWYVMQDANDVWYYQSSGTSMATPFVTACYAMLMSDSSKSSYDDYGLTNWNSDSDDTQFLNEVHKALLAAAATDGVHAEFGYVETFGYGTIDVSGFVPENGVIRTLTEIKYEPQENSSYQNATWGNVDIGGNNDTVDWFKVCVVLAVVSIILYIINNLRERMRSFSKQGETEDDN